MNFRDTNQNVKEESLPGDETGPWVEKPGNSSGKKMITRPIVVRGGGDLASGTVLYLSLAGYPVVIFECGNPTAIRREAAFCEAVRTGEKTVEGVTCRLAQNADEALYLVKPGQPVLLVDEKAAGLPVIRPQVLIDAMIAKKNRGTTIDMADLTIALGPGFTAGKDVHYVIETMRGHNLGRIIRNGTALPNTGIPGNVGGFTRERVVYAPCPGILRNRSSIGDIVGKEQIIAEVMKEDGECVPVQAAIQGVLRGILPDGFKVREHLKMADIDPRITERENCFTVSDKARCIAGSVLVLVSAYERQCLF